MATKPTQMSSQLDPTLILKHKHLCDSHKWGK
jgi:hypothetical protein